MESGEEMRGRLMGWWRVVCLFHYHSQVRCSCEVCWILSSLHQGKSRGIITEGKSKGTSKGTSNCTSKDTTEGKSKGTTEVKKQG